MYRKHQIHGPQPDIHMKPNPALPLPRVAAEIFCQNIVAGMEIEAAARAANVSKAKHDRTAYDTAEKNLNKPDIRARVAQLQIELAESARMTREDVVKRLEMWVMFDEPETSLKAIGLLNRMMGWNADLRINHAHLHAKLPPGSLDSKEVSERLSAARQLQLQGHKEDNNSLTHAYADTHAREGTTEPIEVKPLAKQSVA